MQHIEKPGDSNKNTDRPRSVYIATYGCQMNARDSEVICGLLKKEGYKIIDDPKNAEVILFNTCSVRQHAEDKVWSAVGSMAKRRRQSPQEAGYPPIRYGWGPTPSGRVPLIGIIGCMAQNYKEQVFERAPEVDFVVGPSDIHKIPGILSRFLEKEGQSPSGTVPLFERKIWETDGNIRPQEIYHTGFYQEKDHSYVVISEGCSNHCSYCVVPYVRGELHNRDSQEIIKEIQEALNKGITRITLLGQNVNAYQHNDVNFVRLVNIVNCVKGLKEFSFVTSHPKDTSMELFKVMAESEKLKKSLHLPVQSGSDRILKLMNRGYSRKLYLDLADKYRKIVKGGVLTTDIMVGFPSESEKDFEDIYNLVKEAEFDAAYIFKYSPRPHTQAQDWADNVSLPEKERRHKVILDLQRGISKKKKC